MNKQISIKLKQVVLKLLGCIQDNLLDNSNQESPPSILCYHSVSEADWQFSVDPLEFEKQIEFLSQTKKVISLEEIINQGEDENLNRVAITFDDGYEDIYKKAFPIFKKYGIKAAVFVMGDEELVDRAQLGNNKKLLSLGQIKKLKQAGWEIGFHSRTHSDLTKIDENLLKGEIIQGKQEVEEKLGFKVRYFAYPRGLYSKNIIKAVQKAGFEAGFTVDGGAVTNKNPFKINRVVINKYMSFREYKALLSKPGLIFNAWLEKLIRIKDRKIKNQFI